MSQDPESHMKQGILPWHMQVYDLSVYNENNLPPILDSWQKAVNLGDAQAVQECYAEDAFLNPARTKQPIETPEAQVAYHASLKDKFTHVTLRVRSLSVRESGVIEGVYDIQRYRFINNPHIENGIVFGAVGTRESLKAGFIFVLTPDGKKIDTHTAEMIEQPIEEHVRITDPKELGLI